MSDSQQPPPPGVTSRGCLYVALFFFVLLAASPWLVSALQKRAMLALEKQQADRRQEVVDAVRNGQLHATVLDPLLLPMLANDPACVENLELIFFSIDFTPQMATEVAKFKNLKRMSFYGGLGVERALAGAAQLPVESVGFDSVIVDEPMIRELAKFPNLGEVQLIAEPNAELWGVFESLLPGVHVVTPSRAVQEIPAETTPVEDE